MSYPSLIGVVARPIVIPLLVCTVALSSVLGLTRAMTDEPVDGGWGILGDVWGANVYGDLIFVTGTITASALCALAMVRALQRTRTTPEAILGFILVVGIGLLLHWAVYAVSWSLSGEGTLESYFERNGDSDGEHTSFWSWSWDMMYDDPLLGLESSFTFTWCWGWAGLTATALLVPAVTWAMAVQGRSQAASGPPTNQTPPGAMPTRRT